MDAFARSAADGKSFTSKPEQAAAIVSEAPAAGWHPVAVAGEALQAPLPTDAITRPTVAASNTRQYNPMLALSAPTIKDVMRMPSQRYNAKLALGRSRSSAAFAMVPIGDQPEGDGRLSAMDSVRAAEVMRFEGGDGGCQE